MLEDYVVNVSLPINDTPPGDGTQNFMLGATFGYNPGEDAEDPVWYWDSHDIWLPMSNAAIFSAFKGTLKFIPQGQDLGIGVDSPRPDESPFPAIGDTLILQLWPQDYIKLINLIPEGVRPPKYIVYQNVDRDETRLRVLTLILDHPEYGDHNRKIFMEEGEEEISDTVFRERAVRWLDSEWLNGNGAGVLVYAGDELGVAAAVPESLSSLPAGIHVDHGAPDGVDEVTWKRLSMKVVSEQGVYYSISYLYYLLSNTEHDEIENRFNLESPLIDQINAQVRNWFKVPARLQLQSDEDFARDPDPDPPPAFTDLVLQLRHTDQTRKVPAIFDPFDEAETGFWRVQGWIPEGSYHSTHFPHNLFGQLIASLDFTITESDGSLTFVEPEEFRYRVRFPHWMDFDTPQGLRKRFILGVNMETCRRVFYHDMGTNDIIYRYRMNSTTGQEEPEVLHTTAWMDDSANRRELNKDLQNIKSLGANAIRVWVFEYFEGIRFEFTEPGRAANGIDSALIEARKLADQGSHPHLHCRVFPKDDGSGELETAHVCSGEEFDRIVRDWDARGIRFRVSPDSNTALRTLITNARRLQSLANTAGLKVLWTLWVHYGETKPSVGKRELIYYSDNRTGAEPSRNDASGSIDVGAWANFYQSPRQPNPTTAPGYRAGRLPIEAWIYHALIRVSGLRQSFIENAVRPFVEAMEGDDGALGYDLFNEPDIVWDGCEHAWAMAISGDTFYHWSQHQVVHYMPSHETIVPDGTTLRWGNRQSYNSGNGFRLPTGWKLPAEHIRRFLQECRDAVHLAIVRIHGSRGDKKIFCGVLGQEDALTENEMHLVMRDGHASLGAAANAIRLELSASAITRYSEDNEWVQYDSATNDGVRNVRLTPWMQTQENACLFLEAGDYQYYSGSSPDFNALRIRQRRAVQELLQLAMSQAYAGVFVWHYNNPARTSYGNENNALTEHSGSTEGTPFPTNPSMRYRPAAQEIIDFKQQYRRIIL